MKKRKRFGPNSDFSSTLAQQSWPKAASNGRVRTILHTSLASIGDDANDVHSVWRDATSDFSET
jgi:hypothetical protein